MVQVDGPQCKRGVNFDERGFQHIVLLQVDTGCCIGIWVVSCCRCVLLYGGHRAQCYQSRLLLCNLYRVCGVCVAPHVQPSQSQQGAVHHPPAVVALSTTWSATVAGSWSASVGTAEAWCSCCSSATCSCCSSATCSCCSCSFGCVLLGFAGGGLTGPSPSLFVQCATGRQQYGQINEHGWAVTDVRSSAAQTQRQEHTGTRCRQHGCVLCVLNTFIQPYDDNDDEILPTNISHAKIREALQHVPSDPQQNRLQDGASSTDNALAIAQRCQQ